MPVILQNNTYIATREKSPNDIPAHTLPAGTKIWAFHGWSTVYPDFDFETYSEAGYKYNPEASMFVQPPNAASGKTGLKLVGSSVYARHPSTEVACMAYNLKDGIGTRLWYPNCGWMPHDLFDYVQGGGLLEAHNALFENEIWEHVCVKKYGFPPLPTRQLRCSMSKAAAFAMPSGLDKLSIAIGADVTKDSEGANLMRKLSVPRKPTKNNPALRHTRQANPQDFARQDVYCMNDTAAESSVSAMLPDLQPDELELWLLDQTINKRGVHIDKASLDACIDVVQQAFAKYGEELRQLCGGYYDDKGSWNWNVSAPSEVGNIRVFLAAKGVQTSSLDAEHIAALLARDNLPPECRRVLEIRDMMGAASVKKLYALFYHLCPDDDRVRGLFAFCGADRTGRFAGRGPQPQNMPSGGPTLKQCDPINGCGHYYQMKLANCPWCNADSAFSKDKQEWNPDAVDQALKVIAGRKLEWVEHYFGDAIATISGCLRGLFTAAPGKDFISSDFSAIEAVVLAELAGEQWRIDVFKTHGKIYEMGASKISGVPFEEIIDYKKRTGEHHPLRKKIGKVSELACFTRDTQVLTEAGYKDIVDVLETDKLWDGEQWVAHNGVVNKGKRVVINLDGIEMTPNHPIYLKGSWKEARLLASNKSILTRALEIGSENLPSSNASETTEATEKCVPTVLAEENRLQFNSPTYSAVKPRVVMLAQKESLYKQCTLSTTGSTQRLCLTKSTEEGCLTACLPRLVDAKNQITKCTLTMAEGAYQFANYGKKINSLFFAMCRGFRGGITLIWKWTEKMLMGTTNQGTSNLSPDNKTCLTKEVSRKCSGESNSLRTVYDIVNAGPRNRFTIKTNSGHLIVHNSGYAGWIGAWKNFGADKFMTDQEIKEGILAWRDASPMVVEFWGGQWRKHPKKWEFTPEFYGVEGAAIQAVMNPGTAYTYRLVSYVVHADILYCRLPSGRLLCYHQPRLYQSTAPHGNPVWQLTFMGQNAVTGAWERQESYGGKLAENLCQSVARDILTHAMVNLERAGYHIVLHIHDEIVSEVDKDFGSIEEFEEIMSTMPAWASDWPIKAAGGWRGLRYRKG